jgi:hypothetical protein
MPSTSSPCCDHPRNARCQGKGLGPGPWEKQRKGQREEHRHGQGSWRSLAETGADARQKSFLRKGCPSTMSSRESYPIRSEETKIVTALSARGRIHTFLHHEKLRKEKKSSGDQPPIGVCEAIPLAKGALGTPTGLGWAGKVRQLQGRSRAGGVLTEAFPDGFQGGQLVGRRPTRCRRTCVDRTHPGRLGLQALNPGRGLTPGLRKLNQFSASQQSADHFYGIPPRPVQRQRNTC